jgi:hypothetical protein
MTIGHSVDEQVENFARMKGISVADALTFLGGNDFATKQQWNLINSLGGAKGQLAGGLKGGVARFAGSKAAHGAMRLVPGLATATAALGAADIVAGGDRFGNKVMDAGSMVIGGTIGGMMGGPLGVAVGSSLGKTASDATQAIFGGGRSAEQRRIEEALAALRGGQI